MKKSKKNRILLLAGLTVAVVAVVTLTIAAVVRMVDGKKPEATIHEVIPYNDLLESYRQEKFAEHYKKSLSKMYGFNSKTADSVLTNKKAWKSYSIGITVDNKTDEDITIYSLEIEGNGKNGIWICQYTDGEIGIPKGMKDANMVYVSVLVQNNNLTAENIEKAVKDTNIRLVYSKTPVEENGEENTEVTKTIAVS